MFIVLVVTRGSQFYNVRCPCKIAGGPGLGEREETTMAKENVEVEVIINHHSTGTKIDLDIAVTLKLLVIQDEGHFFLNHQTGYRQQ